MVRLTRCKKCGRLLSSIDNLVNYGDHGWKFTCCKTDYYKCNRDTCCHAKKHHRYFFYQNPEHLDNHIKEFHGEEDITNLPISLDKYMMDKVASTSYQESLSIGTYFREYHCI